MVRQRQRDIVFAEQIEKFSIEPSLVAYFDGKANGRLIFHAIQEEAEATTELIHRNVIFVEPWKSE